MSNSNTKRNLVHAIRDAEAFRALFSTDTFAEWHFGGSVRRGLATVGDIEHVVVPKFGDVDVGGGLFAEKKTVNLFMHRLDDLVSNTATSGVSKHTYGGLNGDGISRTNPPLGYTPTKFRWGDKSRGVDFRGFCHEVYTADVDNLGSVLAIRTGPGGYSKMLVLALQRNGYCNDSGYVWNKNAMWCSHCDWHGAFTSLFWFDPEFWPQATQGNPKFVNGLNRAGVCPVCRNQQGLSMQRISVGDEATYFKLCNVAYVAPAARMDPQAVTA